MSHQPGRNDASQFDKIIFTIKKALFEEDKEMWRPTRFYFAKVRKSF